MARNDNDNVLAMANESESNRKPSAAYVASMTNGNVAIAIISNININGEMAA